MASRKPTDEQWELNKGLIRRLYLVKKSTLQELMKAMAERGFHATKAQFESKIKLWNFRKYLNGDAAWRYVADRISKRETQGKRSRVIVSGIVYDEEKVRREIARYRPCTLLKVDGVERPRTPKGMAICVASPPVLGNISSSWPLSLPWLVFQRKLLKGLTEQDYLASGANTLPSSAEHNPKVTKHLLHDISLACQISSASTACLAKTLGAIMPEEHEFEHLSRAEVLCGKGTKEKEQEAVKTMLFFASNKQIKNDDKRLVEIFQELTATNHWGTLLVSIGGATVAAFGEAVFEAAVVSSSVPVLSFILHNGFSATTRIGMSTALQVATALYKKDDSQRFEVVRTLLDAGADVNGVTQWNSLSPLQLAVAKQWRDGVALFLSRGANVNYTGVEGRHFSWRGRDLFQKDAPLTPFLIATRNFDLRLMIALNDHKAKIDLEPAIDLIMAEAYLYDHESGDDSDDDSSDTLDDGSTDDSSATSYIDAGFRSQVRIDQMQIKMETKRGSSSLNLLRELFFMKRSRAQGGITFGHAISNYAVLQAAYLCHDGILSYFHDEGASMDFETASTKCYPLGAAVQGKKTEAQIIQTCQLLRKIGTRTDPDPHGLFYGKYPSALLHAARRGFPSLVRWLLDNGANPNYGLATILRAGSFEIYTPVNACLWNSGNAECLEILLQRGGRCTGAEVVTASLKGRFHMVKILVCFGADVNQKDDAGQTPLRAALRGSAVDVARYLLQNGASPTNGDAALAITSGDRELVDELLDCSCKLTDDAPNGISALETAISADSGDRHWVDKIMQADPDRYNSSILCAAVYKALSTSATLTDFDVLEDILLRRTSEKCDPVLENTALAMAIYKKNIAVLRMLLDRAPPSLLESPCLLSQKESNIWRRFQRHRDIQQLSSLQGSEETKFRTNPPCSDDYIKLMWRPHSSSPKTSLITSVIICRHYAMIPVLYSRGYRACDLSLLLAVETGRADVVRMVLDGGVSPNAVSQTCRISPFQLAVGWKLRDIVTLLLEAGAYVDSCPAEESPWPRTPLQLAIENGEASTALELIEAGADVNFLAPDAKKTTALNIAIMKGSLDLIKLILDAGADVNAPAQGTEGATALQIASIQGRLGIAKHLLERGADPNAPASLDEGRTAIEGAAEHGRIDMIQLLLEHGVITTGEHHRPFLRAVKYALREGHFVAARLLQNYRAWTEEDAAGLATELLPDEQEENSDHSVEQQLCTRPRTEHDEQPPVNELTETSISERDENIDITDHGHVEDDGAVRVIIDEDGTALPDRTCQAESMDQLTHDSQWKAPSPLPPSPVSGGLDPMISGLCQDSLGTLEEPEGGNDVEGPYLDMLNVLDSDVDWLLSNLGPS